MSSELMKKISGQLTGMDNNALGQFPFGITIEFTRELDSDNPGGWIGSAPIKTSGQFDLFTTYDLPVEESVSYKIFKDAQLITEGTADVIDFTVSIDVNDDTYKQLVQPYIAGCVTIKGAVTFGSDNIPAIPLNPNSVVVEVHKTLFRQEEIVATSMIDAYGRYYIHLPLNLLRETPGSGSNPNAPKFSKVFVSLTIIDGDDTSTIEKSGILDLTNEEIVVDFHTNNGDIYDYVKTEMDLAADIVTNISGLTRSGLSTIITEGDDSELETIAAQTEIGSGLVNKIIYAAKVASTLSVPLNHSYILVQEYGFQLDNWLPIDETILTDQMAKGVALHVIPTGGSVASTYDAIREYEKEDLFNTPTQNGDSLGTVWNAVIDDESTVKTFLQLNSDYSDASKEAFWVAVGTQLPDYVERLRQGVQVLSLNGMQPEMTATTLALLNSEKSYPFITADLTTDVRSLSLLTQEDWGAIVEAVCDESDKLCIPVSIIAQAEINSSDPKDEYANKLFEVTTNVFATTVIKNQLAKDINILVTSPPSHGAKFSDIFGENASDVLDFLTSEDNADFDFRTSNLWDYTDEEVPFRSVALPVQNLMRLTMGKPEVVISMAKEGIKSSGDIVEMSQEAFVQKYAVDLSIMSVDDAQSLYAKASAVSAQTTAATATYTGVGNITATALPTGFDVMTYLSGTTSSGPSTDPDWQNLFGSLDLCGCSECTSMYSPAAYYTDILNFTRKKIDDQTPESKGYKELNQRRRPDLINIELSCKNTNTAIPYVDLVNELLELVILKSAPSSITVNGAISPIPKSYQTTGISKELNAYPEHRYKDANGDYQTYTDYQKVYDFALSSDTSSPKLPFNLALEESRTYLSHLGFNRYDLMDRFKAINYLSITNSDVKINPFNLSAEWLGISKKDAEIITTSVSSPFAFYGFITAPSPTLWYDVLCNGETLQVMGLSQVQGLNTLLERSAITYKELLQLLNTRFLNGSNPTGAPLLKIVSTDSAHPDTCDLTKLKLYYGSNTAIPIGVFQKWYRFLRLQKATGWSIYQLDMVLASFGYSDIDASAFINIAKAHRFAKQFKIVPEKLCAIWSDISTVTYIDYNSDSQNEIATIYDSLFQNKALKNPVDTAFTLPSITATFALNSGTIIAGLNVKEEELSAILEYLDIGSNVTIDKLSSVYGIVQIAKGLRYSIADTIRLFHLFDIPGSQFVGQSAADLFSLLDQLVSYVSIKEKVIFSLEEVEYLLGNKDDNGNYIATDDTIQLFYESLRTELKKLLGGIDPLVTMGSVVSGTQDIAEIAQGTATTAQNTATTTASNASTACIPTANAAKSAIIAAKDKIDAVVADLPNISVTDIDSFYNAQDNIVLAMAKGEEALLAAQDAVIAARDANDFAQAQSTSITLTQQTAAKETAAAANVMYAAIAKSVEVIKDANSTALKLNGLPNVVVQYFTAQFGIDNDTAKYLLNDVIDVAALGTSPASYELLHALILPDFINFSGEITADEQISLYAFSKLFDAYKLLRKITFVTNKYKLGKDEIAFFIDNAINLDILKIDDLPIVDTADTFGNLILLSKLNDWIKVKGTLGLRVDEFIDLMRISAGLPYANATSNKKEDWVLNIQRFTNWKDTDLKTLIGEWTTNPYTSGILNVAFPTIAGSGNFKNASVLLQLISTLSAVDRIGLSAQLVYSVLESDLVMNDSRYIRTAAKSKHDEDTWLKIAKPLQDTLREKQRAALVAYILARPYILDTNYNSSGPSQQVASNYLERCKTENDLFAYLLIDVEMKPCMATSRIKQAISSVQLYLDRIILNLENYVNNPNSTNHIVMFPPAVEQWKAWRKWYRVWEANRKIFLYPENWIEPELRDDKTPVFKELETALLQDEVKDNIVEDAFRNYLEQLEEIGHLEPVGIFRQQEDKIAPGHFILEGTLPKYNLDITHVFGRTSSLPHRYYYRRYEDSVWTPWEKVNVDIKSDHITPVMWNGKLYLFWLTFQKKKLSENNVNNRKSQNSASSTKEWVSELTRHRSIHVGPLFDDQDDDAFNDLEVTLNWSQYKDNKWLANELSKDTMTLTPSKTILSGFTLDSLNDVVAASKAISWLTNNAEVKIDEFFKNRLYLFQTIDEPLIDGQLQGDMSSLKEDNGIAFSIMFVSGLDETATGIHRFLWHGDNHTTPYVSRNESSPLPIKARGYQLLSPLGTRLNKMKFVEDPYGDGKLKQDKITYIVTAAGGPTLNTYFSFESNSIQPGQASIARTSNPPVILGKSNNGTYKITVRASRDSDVHTHYHIPIANEFLFEDEKNTFYAQLEERDVSTKYGNVYMLERRNEYRFQTFYHAQIKKLIMALNKGGVAALLDIQNQKPFKNIFGDPAPTPYDEMAFGVPGTTNSSSLYNPTSLVHPTTPNANMQFLFTEAYGTYNWEVFFHAPMLIAQRLSDNQQFEEAQKWYHYIFNPTSTTNKNGVYTGGKERFWKFYPFYELATQTPQTITELLTAINSGNAEANAQVTQWEKNPFNPHLIARMRKLAYMKNVLMKYIDNLIAWGDQLFSRDTIESINEATQLYVLAANLLGKKPQEIPPRAKSKIYSFADFVNLPGTTGLDALSNVMVNIESFFPPNGAAPVVSQGGVGGTPYYGKMFYFCTPKNDILLGYWDKVADRLFKIRNCMNIEGTIRQLPLFEPPIDPAMLVRATAMGVDINTILDSASGANLPNYRFSYMLQKANEFCGEVRGLGNSLLSALEKKDAEELSLLRSGQELQLMEKVTFIKEQQVADAEQALEAVKLTKENTQMRFQYYSSRQFTNSNEQKHLSSIQTGLVLQNIQIGMEGVVGTLGLIPKVHIQGLASGASKGNWDAGVKAASTALGIATAINNAKGSMAATMGGYERRRDDWKFQTDTASKELEQLDQQILGAEIRLDIAKKELANHEQQVENTTAVDTYMRSKFTNKELYSWMVSQIATTYFQSYQLAYDLAKKADACYRYELPLAKYPAAGFVTFGYWDSLRKGLMSGEKLQFDLRKMEATYMEENNREFELTKNISLVLNDPQALLDLRKNGSCEIYLPEEIYDIDYPGHYNRRIKSVSISIPCIAGPYTTIPATLTLENSYVRKGDDPSGILAIDPSGIGRTMIATSSAQNDSGVFELNFRDERYLPFEGRGAISKWQLNLADEGQVRTFDFDTVSDVIMHVRYTAVHSEGLKQSRIDNINDLFESPTTGAYSDGSFSESSLILPRYFSLKHEFSQDWYKGFDALVTPATGTPSSNIGREINMKISRSQFPEYTKGKTITISNIEFVLKPNLVDSATYWLMLGNQPTSPSTPITYGSEAQFSDVDYGLSLEKSLDRTLESSDTDTNLSFKFYKKISGTMTKIDESDLDDIFFIVNYKLADS